MLIHVKKKGNVALRVQSSQTGKPTFLPVFPAHSEGKCVHGVFPELPATRKKACPCSSPFAGDYLQLFVQNNQLQSQVTWGSDPLQPTCSWGSFPTGQLISLKNKLPFNQREGAPFGSRNWPGIHVFNLIQSSVGLAMWVDKAERTQCVVSMPPKDTRRY